MHERRLVPFASAGVNSTLPLVLPVTSSDEATQHRSSLCAKLAAETSYDLFHRPICNVVSQQTMEARFGNFESKYLPC